MFNWQSHTGCWSFQTGWNWPSDWINLHAKTIVRMPKRCSLKYKCSRHIYSMTFQMLFWSCKAMMRLYTNGPEGPPTPDVALMLIRLVLGCSILVLQLCLTGARCSIKASPVRAAIPRMRLYGVCRVPVSSDLSTADIKWEEAEVTKCCSLTWQWSTPL